MISVLKIPKGEEKKKKNQTIVSEAGRGAETGRRLCGERGISRIGQERSGDAQGSRQREGSSRRQGYGCLGWDCGTRVSKEGGGLSSSPLLPRIGGDTQSKKKSPLP